MGLIGKIIQIGPGHDWFGCLAIVDKEFNGGVQAYVSIPMKGDAYIRLVYDDFIVVGEAMFVNSSGEENE